MFKRSKKCTSSFLLYTCVCITIMVWLQEGIRYMQRLCVAYNFGGTALWYSSGSMQHTYLWGLIEKKICTCFLNDTKNLTTYGYALWCSQIVYIRPYSLNTTTAFYSVTECSDSTVSVWGHVYTTTHSYFTWPWPRLDSVSYFGCSIVPSVTG